MLTYDVSSGHISDYTSEAYCRACFLEAFALAMADKPENDSYPCPEAWLGFFHVTQDFTAFMRALNQRAQGTP